MVRMAISAIAVLFLAGCGSAVPEKDQFEQDCVNYGGSYIDNENSNAGSCLYEQGKP